MKLTVTKDMTEFDVVWKLEENISWYNHNLNEPWGIEATYDTGLDDEDQEPFEEVSVAVEDTDLDSAFRKARRLISDFITDNR
jgi:hypothetical protein